MTENSGAEVKARSPELRANGSQLRLMLIDGHALVHRAFHALPPLTTSNGELVNAVFGFSSMMLKAIETVRPSHIIMAFDRAAPTFRHEAFAEYKATRPRTPEQMVSQFQRVREVAEALNIPIYERDGFEADDLLGTLSLQSEGRELPTTIVTGDLDALQLVSDYVTVLTSRRGIADTTLYDLPAVRERYGLEPSQLIDYKGLVGDTSDNIPGVPGVGQKTASKLLGEHHSLENLFADLDGLNPKMKGLLEQHREQVFQSRELARIVRDAPVELDLEHSGFKDIDRKRLLNLFLELEFRSLIERVQTLMPREGMPAGGPRVSRHRPTQLSIFGGAETDGSNAAGSGADGSFVTTDVGLLDPEMHPGPETVTRVVRNSQDLADLRQQLGEANHLALDTETTGTDSLRCKLVGLSLSTKVGEAWYVPVGHADGEQVPTVEVIDVLRTFFEDEKIKKVGHNLKYDTNVLRRYGTMVKGLFFDTMVAAYLVDSTARGLSLSGLAMSRLGIEMTPIDVLIGKGKKQITMDLLPIDDIATYAGADAEISLRLQEVLTRELEARELSDLFHSIEMPLVSVLGEMEWTGVCVDTEVLAEMSRDMTEIIGRLEGRIYEAVGHRFNISSTQQLGQVLFGELKMPSGRRTKTGWSTDNEVLEGLKGQNPVVDDILEFRQLIKLKNTYVDALPSLINAETGKVHTDFNQTVAATGRLSSSNPNLQNIPIRGELGRKVRRAFVPSRAENVLLAADYSQIELRVMAAMSKDERLIAAFESREDIHRATASAVFSVPLSEVTADQRRIAKVVNFGIMYGLGEQRLAYETGITRQEAREFIENYNNTYSGVKTFMEDMKKRAVLYGYVSTMLNRRRYIPDVNSGHPGVRSAAERAAINMPIQGTAADIIKIAMIRLHEALSGRFPHASMVLQVHDELVFDVPANDLGEVARLVQETMEQAHPLGVPVEVELKVGRDWYDMAELETVAA